MKDTNEEKQNLVKKIIRPDWKVEEFQVRALDVCLQELSWSEYEALRSVLYSGWDYDKAALGWSVSKSRIQALVRKAIRHLRAPKYLYRIVLGIEGYRDWCGNHKGTVLISSLDISTKTRNVLKNNGFVFIEEVADYIKAYPERLAYFEGLGKLGMTEVAYYLIRHPQLLSEEKKEI